MHIPDGFLSTPVWLSLGAASAPAVGAAARQAQRELEDTRIPLLGVMGAFVFAAQMINFPVGVGTSGHLVGAALLAIVLGPAAAIVVMTAILAIQAFVFQDGGVLALGANVLNMGVAGVIVGYLPYRFWGGGRLRPAAVFLSGFLSVLSSASLAIIQLVLSGTTIPRPMLGISLALFTVAAALEGAITLAVVRGIEALSPNMVRRSKPAAPGTLFAIVAVAVLLAGAGVFIASAQPDGLERLALNIGLDSQAKALFPAPLSDYDARFLASPWLRKATAGMVGLALIYAAAALFGRMAARRRDA